jgi:hypothetical protein
MMSGASPLKVNKQPLDAEKSAERERENAKQRSSLRSGAPS